MLRAAAEDGTAADRSWSSYPLYQLAERLRADAALFSRGYRGRLRIGGLEIILDGSPQGKSAWLTEPYLVPPPGEPASYGGIPLFADDDVYRMVADCFAQRRSAARARERRRRGGADDRGGGARRAAARARTIAGR